MAGTDRTTWNRRLRNHLVTGLLVLVPVAVTVYVLYQLFLFMDGLLGDVVNRLLGALLGYEYRHFRIPGLGLVALFLILLLTGVVARNYLGRKVIEIGDRLITRVPLVNKIYASVQQISRAFFSERREFFKQAVLIEYPRRGVYSIAFFTQDTRGEVQDRLDQDVVSVFVPTTPNPTSGFLLFVPRSEVIELQMSIEEALKLVISGGAVTPDDRRQVQRLVPPEALPDRVRGKLFEAVQRRPGREEQPGP